jgi:hypothetical protein
MMLTNQHHHGHTNLNAAKIKIKFQSRKRSNQKFIYQREKPDVRHARPSS